MPLYEYECDACQHRFERIQKFSDPLVDVCPKCAGHVHKLFSSPAIQFKGTGWYITDYAKKSGTVEASSSSKTESGEKGDKGDKGGKGSDSSEKKSSESSDSKPSSTPSKGDNS